MRSIRLAARSGFVIALALAASVAAQPAPPAQPAGRAALARMTVADLEKGIMSSPGATAIAAVKRYYPDQYRLLLEEMLAKVKASDGSVAAAHLIGAQAMRAFMLRRGPELINAPAALLNRINSRQLELMRGMGRDQVALCAEYATTGFTGNRPLPEPYLSQAGALSVLFIEASRAGADRPREAGRGTLSNEDAVAWYQAVQRVGTAQDVLDAMAGAGTDSATPAPQDVNCRMGIAVYAAIDALPPEQAARVAAYFLQEGMKSQAAQ